MFLIHKYRTLVFFLTSSFTFFSGDISAQEKETAYRFQPYLKSYFLDTKDLLFFPKQITVSDHDFLAASILIIPAGFMFDESIERYFRRQQLRNVDEKVIDFSISNFGNGIYPGAAALVLYGFGVGQKREDMKWLALLQIKTIGLSAAASRIPKFMFQRHRPDEQINIDPWKWEGPFHGFSGNYSFTSGHTFIAFSWASVTASALSDKKGVALALYSVASLVGISRIVKGEHWSSDVLTGAVLGYALGKLTYRLQEKNWMKKPDRKGTHP